MSWRIHLANQAIIQLDILAGREPALAAWTRRDRVSFYHLENGLPLGEHHIGPSPDGPRSGELWQNYLAALHGPGEKYFLPLVHTARGTVYSTDDGRMRLYHTGDADLYLETDGQEVQLDADGAERFVALDLDRALGLVAALDESGRLHIYQQNLRIGAFEIGLDMQPDLRPVVTVPRGGGAIYASDGRCIVATDLTGRVCARLETHYYVGQMACSPGGGMLVTSDLEIGVLRVYNSEGLMPTHQRFAIDLLAGATQLQLLADIPPVNVAVSALSAHNRGTIAFAIAGVICVTDVSRMVELPRPQTLF